MLTYPELGTIEFVRNPRSKCIRVRILNSGLKVTLPFSASEEEALHFIESVRHKLLEKRKKHNSNIEKSGILIDQNTRLQTLTFIVEAHPSERENIHFSLKDNCLKIKFPEGTDCSDHRIQEFFWNGISHFLRKEAKRILPFRTKQLAAEFGFIYSRVQVQSSKSRWGSCSRERSINLSLYLLLLPPHLIDYVILHELCHTKEMNHGERFWAWMDKVTQGKSKALRAELKKYHMPQ